MWVTFNPKHYPVNMPVIYCRGPTGYSAGKQSRLPRGPLRQNHAAPILCDTHHIFAFPLFPSFQQGSNPRLCFELVVINLPRGYYAALAFCIK